MTLEQVSQRHIDLGSGPYNDPLGVPRPEQVFPPLGLISLQSNTEIRYFL